MELAAFASAWWRSLRPERVRQVLTASFGGIGIVVACLDLRVLGAADSFSTEHLALAAAGLLSW